MAKKTYVELIDDFDGSPAVETIPFAVGGVSYEIDLNEANREAFLEALAPYVAAAARTQSAAKSRGKTGQAASNDTAKIRAWAQKNGYTVSDRGRISKAIREAYYSAN